MLCYVEVINFGSYMILCLFFCVCFVFDDLVGCQDIQKLLKLCL